MPFQHRYITAPRIKPARRFYEIALNVAFSRPNFDFNDLAAQAGILYSEAIVMYWGAFLGSCVLFGLAIWSVMGVKSHLIGGTICLTTFFASRFLIAQGLWRYYKSKSWNHSRHKSSP